MKGTSRLRHEFVEFLPEVLEEGLLYISIPYATASHLCCCGCGHHVVTPISPTDWKLIFDGETVSLDPSIGNWSFPCRSHYWIKRDAVRWEGRYSPDQVAATRERDRAVKVQHHSDLVTEVEVTASSPRAAQMIKAPLSAWEKACGWFWRE